MASYRSRIKHLEEERRKNLRQAKRAMQRRRKALLRRDWAAARSALRVARRKRAEAQENLDDIRVIRKERSAANRAARLLRHRRSAGRDSTGLQLYWFDGKKCTAEAYKRLKWARANGWRGVLVSGHRDPIYSERLCYAMCGRPFCSGRCAGRSSNHVRGAIDVSDYTRFGELMKRCPYTPRWYNALGARDPVHFSWNGR